MNLNQTISKTTEVCLDTTQTGYCAVWEKTTTNEIGWINPLYLGTKIFLGIFIIFALIKFRVIKRKG